jgi:hypothetical protein
MKVLVACEFSGVVRDAFIRRGHDAWSCDLLPTQAQGPHIQMDVLAVLDRGWDLMIAHPPCTYISGSGLHWNHRRPGRADKTEAALDFFRQILFAPIDRICIENPVGCASTRIRKPNQIIQPYNFGEDASKATCLCLVNLPKLKATAYFPPRTVVDGDGVERKRWSNQTDSGQNKLPPSDDRWAIRSVTYSGIAEAMAEQWGGLGPVTTPTELFGELRVIGR